MQRAPGGSPLPAPLAAAVEARLAERDPRELAGAARALSERYRAAIGASEAGTGGAGTGGAAGSRPGRRGPRPSLHGSPLGAPTALDVDAYLATRLPATYAAVDHVLDELEQRVPGLAPRSITDVGAGPGTATWAALDRWPSAAAALVERTVAFADAGRDLADAAAPGAAVTWHAADLRTSALPPAELAIAGYVLCELDGSSRAAAVDRLWDATIDTLVIVEPGTPAMSAALLATRTRLLAAGARVVAPCPHGGPCPFEPAPGSDAAGARGEDAGAPSNDASGSGAGGWCHFSVRLPRSRRHRAAKGADAGFEDERFSYLVVRRADRPVPPATPAAARVIGSPRRRGGGIDLPLCTPTGATTVSITARDREAHARARRLRWGDAVSFDRGTTGGSASDLR